MEMVTVAKMTDGKLVEIVRIAETVAFSTDTDWILLCFDFEKANRKRDHFKWVKASDVKFEWVRDFT
jgi:hypothetical protein